MKNKKVNSVEMTKNKTKFTIICLVFLIVLLVGYIFVDKLLLSNKEKCEDKSKIENKEESKKEKVDIDGTFVFREEERIYVANAKEFLKSGKKDFVIYEADELADIEVYKNKIYYFDDSNNLRIYDIASKKEVTYGIDFMNVDAGTIILPGEDYVIVSDIEHTAKIDLKTKKYTLLNINTNNYSMIFDDETNTFYYLEDYKIIAYDINNDKKLGTIGEGLPVYVDEKYIYINSDSNGINYLDLYDKNTKKTISIKKEFGHHYDYISSYNENVYMFSENRLIKVSNNKKEVFYEDYFLEVVNTNRGIFIKTYGIEEDTDIITPSSEYSIYEYDYESRKIEEVNDQYVSDLFDNYTYYVAK